MSALALRVQQLEAKVAQLESDSSERKTSETQMKVRRETFFFCNACEACRRCCILAEHRILTCKVCVEPMACYVTVQSSIG